MKKRILSLALALFLVLALVPVTVALCHGEHNVDWENPVEDGCRTTYFCRDCGHPVHAQFSCYNLDLGNPSDSDSCGTRYPCIDCGVITKILECDENGTVDWNPIIEVINGLCTKQGICSECNAQHRYVRFCRDWGTLEPIFKNGFLGEGCTRCDWYELWRALDRNWLLPFADLAAASAILDEKEMELHGRDDYADAVRFMLNLNIMTAFFNSTTGEYNLNLGSNLTRSEFAVMLFRAMHGGDNIDAYPMWGAMSGVACDTDFHWSRAYANWMISTGIAGFDLEDGTDVRPLFIPDRAITLNEALYLCMKAIGLNCDIEKTLGFTYPDGVWLMAEQIETATGKPMNSGLVATQEFIDRASRTYRQRASYTELDDGSKQRRVCNHKLSVQTANRNRRLECLGKLSWVRNFPHCYRTYQRHFLRVSS
jgi:hypothetical protein